MTTVQIEAGTLTASRADRTVSGLLLPFGEIGRTNLGKFSVDPGVIEVPEDLTGVGINDEHTREGVLGAMATATETPAGIFASFNIAKTPAGDKALAEIEAGTRTSLSAEVSGMVIKAGRAIAGRLFGAALVKTGAFPNATLFASDFDDEAGDELPDPATLTEADAAMDAIAALSDEARAIVVATLLEDVPAGVVEEVTPPAEEDVMTAKIATAPAGNRTRRPGVEKDTLTASDMFAKIAAAHGSMTSSGTMLAALDAIIASDASPAQQAQWLDEIWKSRTYNRRYVPLISHADLTSMKAVGWRFKDGLTPTVGDYAGYPAQPVSTEVSTEAVEVAAKRIAGANEFDRAFVDFSVPGFWEGFYREQANDYARKSDAKVPAFLAAAAGAVVADTVPVGVAEAASFIVDGAVEILGAEIGLPSFAIVGTGLYKDLLKTRADDMLAFLNMALGLEDGTIESFKVQPSSLPAFTGKVLVGTKDAATFYELPGSPVRVDTVNIANGSGQTGVFGYYAELVNQAQGLALVEADGI